MQTFLLRAFLVGGIFLGAVQSARAASHLVFKADADTSLVQERPGDNFGGDIQLHIGTIDRNNSVALLHFDLGALPGTGAVLSAYIELTPISSPAPNANVRRVLKPWGEGSKSGPAAAGEATWLAAKTGELSWSAPGAGIGPDLSAETRGAAENVLNKLRFLANASMAADIEEWRQNADSNYGWAVETASLCCGQSTVRRDYVASENGALAPELHVFLGDPKLPRVFLDPYSELIEDQGLEFGRAVTVRVVSAFPDGQLYYTLDGRQPDLNSARLPDSGSFVLTNSAVLRVLNYSADFSQKSETAAIQFTHTPSFSAVARTSGGGSTYVIGTPEPASTYPLYYLSNSVVRALAVPAENSVFLRWIGSVADPLAADTTALVTTNLDLIAIFGAPLKTTVQGQGTLLLQPPNGPYEFGQTVRITPVPGPGYYFAQWGNAASGTNAPLEFVNSRPSTVSALFLPVEPSDGLALQIEGGPDEVVVKFTGIGGSAYTIERSEDLRAWTEAASISKTEGAVEKSFPRSGKGYEFYRVAVSPGL